MKNIVINVTQEHINRGIRSQPTGCMVALALECALPLCCPKHVTTRCDMSSITSVAGDDQVYKFNMPLVASDAIVQFDISRTRVEPFSFTLEVPDWAVAEEPVRNPIAASCSARSHDPIQGEHIPDGRHGSRAPLIASSVPVLALLPGI